MKNRKIIIVICILVGLLLLFSAIQFIMHPTSKKEESEFLDNLDYHYDRVSNCVDSKSRDCAKIMNANYAVYSFNEDIPAVKEMITKLNQQNENQKKEDQKYGTAQDEACTAVKDKYKYRYSTITLMEYLESKDDLITFSQDTIRTDLCEDTQSSKTDIYVYSKKQGKFLETSDELFDAFHYSKEEINEIIVKDAKEFDNRDVDPTKITEYKLTYNSLTQLIILYRVEGDEKWYYAYH